jgi:hypothetical protein
MSSIVINVYFPLFLKPNIAKMLASSQKAKSAKIFCGFYYFSKNLFPNENLTKASIYGEGKRAIGERVNAELYTVSGRKGGQFLSNKHF